jgi:cell division septum initiation protein DivIVA
MPGLPLKPKPVVAKPKKQSKLVSPAAQAELQRVLEEARKKEVELKKAGKKYADFVLGKPRSIGYIDRETAADLQRIHTGRPLRGRRL